MNESCYYTIQVLHLQQNTLPCNRKSQTRLQLRNVFVMSWNFEITKKALNNIFGPQYSDFSYNRHILVTEFLVTGWQMSFACSKLFLTISILETQKNKSQVEKHLAFFSYQDTRARDRKTTSNQIHKMKTGHRRHRMNKFPAKSFLWWFGKLRKMMIMIFSRFLLSELLRLLHEPRLLLRLCALSFSLSRIECTDTTVDTVQKLT